MKKNAIYPALLLLLGLGLSSCLITLKAPNTSYSRGKRYAKPQYVNDQATVGADAAGADAAGSVATGKKNKENSKEKNNGKSRTYVTIVGVLVAYGNEPHTQLMIQTADGRLYLPDPVLLKELKKLGPYQFEWSGWVDSPREALPGMVPQHNGVLMDIRWKQK